MTPSPRKNMLIGITHTHDGAKIIREPKVLKVGVGLPRGKAVDVWVDNEGYWNIRQGNAVSGKLSWKTVARVKERANAEAEWRKAYDAADLCGYPRKVPYFVLTRPIIGKDGAEVYIPDFAATEAYSFADPNRIGAPTEIDILFLEDEPFSGQYAMWSSSELRCSGDGENASRSVNMYDEEKKVPDPLRAAWKQAKSNGERNFPIVGGCWTMGCPFAKEKDGKPSPCKPSADLKFQLSRNIRVGGTAFFHTSGYRSIIQIFSAVERIKELTGGRIAGVPLKLVLRSYKTNHNGQSALQSGVSLEFRAEDFESVRKNLIEQSYKFRLAAGLPGTEPSTKLIESADVAEAFEESPMSASAMAGEFYPDNDEDGDASPVTTNAPETQQKSAERVADIAEKLTQYPTTAAAPSNVTQIRPDKAPWADDAKPRVKMTEMFQAMLRELGKADYSQIMEKHGLTGGLMKQDAPEAAACYREMQELLKLKEEALAEQAAQQAAATPAQQAARPVDDDPKPLF